MLAFISLISRNDGSGGGLPNSWRAAPQHGATRRNCGLLARRPADRGAAQKLKPTETKERPDTSPSWERALRARRAGEDACFGPSLGKRRLFPFCPISSGGPLYFVISARLRKTCARKGVGMRFARVRARGAFGLGLLPGKGFPLAGPTWFQRVSRFAPRSGSRLCPDWFQVCFQIGPRLVPRLFPDCSQIASRLLPDSPQNPLRFPQKLPQFASGTVQNTPPFCLHLVRDFFLHARFQGARSF